MSVHEQSCREVRGVACLVAVMVLALLWPGAAAAGGGGGCERIENLETFARVYGYARYFNPSDEAVDVDWDQLAIDGAEQVMQVCSSAELAQLLADLFEPVAPGIVFLAAGQPAPEPVLSPGEDVLAWQHYGVLLGTYRGYLSIRTNRENYYPPMQNIYGNVYQMVVAEELRGKEIRMRAAARIEAPSTLGFPFGLGYLWLRVDRENGEIGFLDTMADRPISSSEWAEYEISGPVADDAIRIVFGAFLSCYGNYWLDAFELEARDPGGPWLPVTIANQGFEESVDELSGWGTLATSSAMTFAVDDTNPYAGARCALVTGAGTPAPAQLFEALPEVGETVVKDIGSGLQMSMPLALPATSAKSFGFSPRPAADAFPRTLSQLDSVEFNPDFWSVTGSKPGERRNAAKAKPGSETPTRLAAVIIAWTTLQHFYPYFDVVGVNWDWELKRAMQRAIKADSDYEFYYVLKRLFSALQDGHGHVYGDVYYELSALPIRAAWIEEQAVVTASLMPEIQVGDIIERVDGVRIDRYLRDAEQYLPGSPQWRRFLALVNFDPGYTGTEVTLSLLREDGRHRVVAERSLRGTLPVPLPDQITTVAEGIYYVDLDRASMTEIYEQIDDIAAADGVIFDVRGYPNSNHYILDHLVDDLAHSANFVIPQYIYPDQENVTWDWAAWDIWPAEPRIQGTVVFITDESAVSYAESVMGCVEDNQLAEIVGRPTAGANGNANIIRMPGSFYAYFTGMVVQKQDGSQHHNIGIQPTVPVERTVAAIRAGRDEDLETAIALIQSANP